MQSIEQSSTTDIGEDVILIKDINVGNNETEPPGQNLVFGDLFELKSSPNFYSLPFVLSKPSVYGPTQCLIYIRTYLIVLKIKNYHQINNLLNKFIAVTRIIQAPAIIIKLILGLVNISRSTVDYFLCKSIEKLLRFDVYEIRLTMLTETIEEHLFGHQSKQMPASATELLTRQQQARLRLEKISTNLGNVADTIQSPALNKHLMYCLFDIIIAEMYPELDSTIS